ncbi:unnamed protein product [Sphenostylis stenocarpa]|uniref:Uncharacterized protein n=1 Tax=Sphenostylis stenocarpa TaxID=92480 RepID=A0AA86S5P9_9FABA|nr:unnamed protein product [Sphenostylis stenocarpa]
MVVDATNNNVLSSQLSQLVKHLNENLKRHSCHRECLGSITYETSEIDRLYLLTVSVQAADFTVEVTINDRNLEWHFLVITMFETSKKYSSEEE